MSLYNFMPFAFFINNDYLLLFFLIIFYVPNIIKLANALTKPTNFDKIYSKVIIPLYNDKNNNIYYDRVIWFLQKKYNIYQKSKKLIIKDIYIISNDRELNLKRTRPCFECVINHPIKFYFNNDCYFIKTTNDKSLIIYGKDINKINELINICSREYIKYHDKDPYNDNKIFKIRKENEWVSFPINVKKNFSNIFLEGSNLLLIKNIINEFVTSEDFYIKSGQPYKLGFLFYGPPGCGKTSTIYAIANEYNRNIYSFNLKKIETDHKLEKMFRNIKTYSIIVIEDIDCHELVRNRTLSNEHDISCYTKKPTLGTLLHILDGYHYLNGCIIIFTTNNKNIIDNAVIRPGRIDHQIKFDFCKINQIKDIYKYYTGKKLIKSMAEIFEKKKFTSSKIINSIVLPNRQKPNNIIKIFQKYIIN